MFGNGHIASGNHERDGGRDVKAVAAIATGAADVYGVFGSVDADHLGAHGHGRTSDFFSRFAAVGKVDKGRLNLLIGHLSVEHFSE
jgi:hypothetical protein